LLNAEEMMVPPRLALSVYPLFEVALRAFYPPRSRLLLFCQTGIQLPLVANERTVSICDGRFESVNQIYLNYGSSCNAWAKIQC